MADMRLIDANALPYSRVRIYHGVLKNGEPLVGGVSAVVMSAAIKDAPTIDAVPVVHGRWIWHEDKWEHECSHCHCGFDYDKTYLMFDHGYEYASYCPNCGAKMDGHDTNIPTDRGCSTCANDGYDMPQCRECTEHPGYPWYKRKDEGAE